MVNSRRLTPGQTWYMVGKIHTVAAHADCMIAHTEYCKCFPSPSNKLNRSLVYLNYKLGSWLS